MKEWKMFGVLLAVAGLSFSPALYAQEGQEEGPRVVPVEVKLPQSITLYSPETGEEDVVYIDESLAYVEGIEAENDGWLASAEEEEDEDVPFGLCSSKEDATQITDKRIVFLDITTTENKKSQCSGAMVGDYAVLTAAHCVRDAKDITAYAGGKGSSRKANKDRVYYSGLHTRYGPIDSEYDWGIIVLKTALGKKTGAFGASAPTLYTTDKVSTLGFPGSLAKDRPWLSQGKVLPKPSQPMGMIATIGGAFNHSAWIEGGYSGGPIFKGWGDRNRVIAVNSGAYLDTVSVGSGLGIMPNLVNKAREYRPSSSGKSGSSKSNSQKRSRRKK